MINSINPTGKYTQVHGGGSTYIYGQYGTQQYNSQSAIGDIRYNISLQCTEVFDGSTWKSLGNSALVGLTPHAEQILDWANKKMIEDQELQAKIEKYPTLKNAYDQFKMVEALVHEEEQSGS